MQEENVLKVLGKTETELKKPIVFTKSGLLENGKEKAISKDIKRGM